MQVYDTKILYAPQSDALRFLPEGPRQIGPDRLSWVAIQHGPQEKRGSLNILDLISGQNQSYALHGRPGFAVPTSREGVFLIGLERELVLYDTVNHTTEVLNDQIEAGVENTIINDGEVFSEGVVFGAKHLKFSDKIAGLYFFRSRDRRLFKLLNDRVCSNGKALRLRDGTWTLFDICSVRKSVMQYELDVERGSLREVRTAVDLTQGSVFPDGMTPTPDGNGVIIAIYNPDEVPAGEARQYNLATGEIEAVWRTEASPQVTCPRLIQRDGRVQLVLTTAVENMSDERKPRAYNAGCLFVGETPFKSANREIVFEV